MPDCPPAPNRPPTAPPAPPPAVPPRRVASRDLLGGGREVLIDHGETTYRLRVTASNKLILIK